MNKDEIRKNDYSDEFKRDDAFWNMVGIHCGIMIILCLIGIFFMLFINVQHANAGEMDAWEFNIMGINPADFKDREPLHIIGGAVLSLAVHELGHYAVGELTGMDVTFDWDKRAVYATYNDASNDERALYYSGGFIAQTLVGGILTGIPSTRHSDWTFGFNTFSSLNGFYYAVTDGTGHYSDTLNLDEVGYNGTAIAAGSGIINGGFAYISLNKDKE